jgi:hypothetical protein
MEQSCLGEVLGFDMSGLTSPETRGLARQLHYQFIKLSKHLQSVTFSSLYLHHLTMSHQLLGAIVP